MNTLFLSSTFNDMQKERDAFHQFIVPYINKFLSVYGQSIQLCDLRWGVDTSENNEEESTKKIINVCFDSIRTSDPFFVVMIGERYGWIPPYEYTENIRDFDIEYHNQSVTEMEIEYQTILSKDRENRAIYFFREPLLPEQMTEESKKIYFSEDESSKNKLLKLKERIRRENPGRVFDYCVDWDHETQDYNVESFVCLVVEKLKEVFENIFRNQPFSTTEEIVLNESAAYFDRRAHLDCGNAETLTQCFRDLLKQVKGETVWANEMMSEILRHEGKLEEYENEDKYDPFRAIFLRKEGDEIGFLAGIYQLIPRMELSRELLPIPFVAGINCNAQSGQQLLRCIIRALEKKILVDAGISWIDGNDMTLKVKELIEYRPWGRYPEGTGSGERYYLEKLMGEIRKKHIVVFLLVEKFERLTDNFARNMEFLTATGTDNERMYMMLDMTQKCYDSMPYMKLLNGKYVYELQPMRSDDRRRFVEEYLTKIGKKLPKKSRDSLGRT